MTHKELTKIKYAINAHKREIERIKAKITLNEEFGYCNYKLYKRLETLEEQLYLTKEIYKNDI